MLEETGIEYTVHPINIREGEQFDEKFLAFSPNNRIPAMVDRNGFGGNQISVFESGAMLIYLADKSGQFLPSLKEDPTSHYDVMQWLMFQMGGVGPMQGQAHVFYRYAPEKNEYAIARYQRETRRLYEVLDRQLKDKPYLAGEFSIADIACWPGVRIHNWAGVELTGLDHLERWITDLYARPAFQKGICIPYKVERGKETLDESRKRSSKMLV